MRRKIIFQRGTEAPNGSRIKWIDTAKGLGMVLVLFGHSPLPEQINKYIYTFHIPAFFFLSGYLFSPDKYLNFTNFCARKFKSLFVPYCTLSLINYFCWLFLRKYTSRPELSLYKPLVGIIYAVRGSVWSMCSGTLWFVACLICAELIFYLIIKCSKNGLIKIIICLIISSVIGYLYSSQVSISLPWSIDASLTAVVFYGLGYITKPIIGLINVSDICSVYLAFFILCGWIFGMFNIGVDMALSRYGNYFLFYIAALAGISAFITFVRVIDNSRILMYIGKNALIFLGLHKFVIFNGFDRLAKHLGILHSTNPLLLMAASFLYVVFAIIILMPIIWLINNHLPFIIGKAKHT